MARRSRTRDFGTSNRISHDASAYYASRLYEGLSPDSDQHREVAGDVTLPESARNRILLASAEQMIDLPDRSVHLMVTSPPYNVTKQYDEDLTLREYLGLLRSVFGEVYRVLTEGGRACVNVANLGRKPYIPLSAHIAYLMYELGFLQRGEIIWQKGAGAGVSMAWGSWRSASNPVLRDTHEYILIFSKGTFRRDARGRESTIGRDDFMEWTKSVWTMKTESAKRVGHPAPFPVELPARLIQLYTFRGDVVLDPFMGSGTTAVAALQADRTYVGYETSAEYHACAEARVRALLDPQPPAAGASQRASRRTTRRKQTSASAESDAPHDLSTTKE